MTRPRAAGWLACIALGAIGCQELTAQSLKAGQRELRAALRELDTAPESGTRAVAAIEHLGNFDTKAGTRALLNAASELARQKAPIVADRRKALLGEGGSGRLKRSRYLLRNLDDAAEAIAATLRRMRSTEAVQVMCKQFTDSGNTLPLWLRLQLAERAGELPATRLDWRSRQGKKNDDDTLLALLAATAALGRRVGEGDGGAWVVTQLQHKNSDVRAAAARTLGRLAWPGAIEHLIPRVDAEQGAQREAVLDALVVLTGQNPGDSTASWRAWLAAEGEPFLRGEVPLSHGDATIRVRKSKSNTVSGSYFGIEQSGRSILYVFDNSLSMRAKVGKRAAGGAATTGPKPETRWQLCRRELASALRGLTSDKRFNLVSFANKARSFEHSMQPATKANVERAIDWLNALELEFQTNVYDALELAFVLAGRGTDDRYYRSNIDTIFFLSDGAPTIPHLKQRGIAQDDCDRILAAMRRWNALGRITVHTIGIGLQPRRRDRNDNGRLFPPAFLRLLAEQHGGRFAERR